jgi:hypothetical protein
MSDNNIIFDPEKVSIVEFKMVKGQVDVPEEFETSNVKGHHLDNSLQLGFNLDEKMANPNLYYIIVGGFSDGKLIPKDKCRIL